MRKALLIGAVAISLASLAACEFSTGSNEDQREERAEADDEKREQAESREFVNSRDNARSDSLREHYVDFRFDYPEVWTITPQPNDGTAQNYVRIASPLIDGYESYAFHVGSAYGTGDGDADRAQFELLLPQVSAQFGANFNDYRVTSSGAQRLGEHDTLGWRFEANGPGIGDSAPVDIHGRGDILLPPGATRGVLIVTLATSRQGEVTSADELGNSGVIADIFDSFRLD
ncbi:MAG: hypothetical protein H7X93_02855 [Sphingomonadaceae bacterium]|nr:hypothetical protein [Sphingomonadaceae bacterium]